ncbi:hypothetical protein PLICRDRAFT_86682 [Plicaturopsis crispa FD-325 SS-3]|nr:hypothetical protein PLICRDRAFT_86682 [Plicaturopsis crispa FD-325 SS-3]
MADASTSKKRKSDASTSGAKKARTGAASSPGQALVDAILANPTAYPVPDDADATRQALVDLATYARSLEGGGGAGASKPAPKTKEQIEEAAEKVRKAARSGIRKQMTWKPSCKTGSARWVYDGVCNDAEVFGALLGLGGPPTFKMKKIPKADFEDAIGDLNVSIRYDTLSISGSEVTVRWQPDEGTFKFSGTYGK